jgi:hypothetical protein
MKHCLFDIQVWLDFYKRLHGYLSWLEYSTEKSNGNRWNSTYIEEELLRQLLRNRLLCTRTWTSNSSLTGIHYCNCFVVLINGCNKRYALRPGTMLVPIPSLHSIILLCGGVTDCFLLFLYLLEDILECKHIE